MGPPIWLDEKNGTSWQEAMGWDKHMPTSLTASVTLEFSTLSCRPYWTWDHGSPGEESSWFRRWNQSCTQFHCFVTETTANVLAMSVHSACQGLFILISHPNLGKLQKGPITLWVGQSLICTQWGITHSHTTHQQHNWCWLLTQINSLNRKGQRSNGLWEPQTTLLSTLTSLTDKLNCSGCSLSVG